MGPNPLIPLERTTIRHRSGHRPEGKPHSPYFPCLCGNMEEGMIFRSQESSIFVTMKRSDRTLREKECPESRRDSVKDRKMRRGAV